MPVKYTYHIDHKENGYGVYWIFFGGLMVCIVIGIFLWADYKVKKRNKEEYERTGVMPEYSNEDASRYVLDKQQEFVEKSKRYRLIFSGIGLCCGGIYCLNMIYDWVKNVGGNIVEPVILFLLLLASV